MENDIDKVKKPIAGAESPKKFNLERFVKAAEKVRVNIDKIEKEITEAKRTRDGSGIPT